MIKLYLALDLYMIRPTIPDSWCAIPGHFVTDLHTLLQLTLKKRLKRRAFDVGQWQ